MLKKSGQFRDTGIEYNLCSSILRKDDLLDLINVIKQEMRRYGYNNETINCKIKAKSKKIEIERRSVDELLRAQSLPNIINYLVIEVKNESLSREVTINFNEKNASAIAIGENLNWVKGTLGIIKDTIHNRKNSFNTCVHNILISFLLPLLLSSVIILEIYLLLYLLYLPYINDLIYILFPTFWILLLLFFFTLKKIFPYSTIVLREISNELRFGRRLFEAVIAGIISSIFFTLIALGIKFII